MKFDPQLMQEEIDRRQAHRAQHEAWHRTLDELCADFLAHNPRALPSQTSIIQLMQWSNRQTKFPTP